MVEQLGVNLLIPILVFTWLCVGAYVVSDEAFSDVLRRRKEGGE